MKNLILLITLGFLLIPSFTFGQNEEADKKAIENVIQSAYVEGLQNEGDSVKIDAGFHPEFRLLGIGDEKELRKYDLKDWRARQIQNRKANKLPRPQEHLVSFKTVFIDITGDVAVAKIDYLEGNQRTYVDYISLYRYDSGWRIVSKIYQDMRPKEK